MVTIIEPYGENIMSEFLEQMEHIVDAPFPTGASLFIKSIRNGLCYAYRAQSFGRGGDSILSSVLFL